MVEHSTGRCNIQRGLWFRLSPPLSENCDTDLNNFRGHDNWLKAGEVIGSHEP